MRSLTAFLLLVFLFLAPPGVSANDKKKKAGAAPRESGKGLNFYSPEREIALGQQLALHAERSARLIHDPVVVGYVTQIADRIARSSDAQMPVQVRIVDSDQVGAFALPGGYLFVNSGLLLEAQTEAELAGVLAHEIAHVAARHATKQMTRIHIWNLASIPLMFFRRACRLRHPERCCPGCAPHFPQVQPQLRAGSGSSRFAVSLRRRL